MSRFLDAEYNEYLDNTVLRISLIAAGFAVWLAAGVSVLRLAA